MSLRRTPVVSLFVRRHVPLVAVHCMDDKLPSLIIIPKEYGLVAIQIVQTKLVQSCVL
jgi:hypothetical protein